MADKNAKNGSMAKDEVKKQLSIDFSDPEILLAVLEQIQNQKQPAIDRLTTEVTERLEKLAKFGEDLMLISKAEYHELKNGSIEAPPPPERKAKVPAAKPKEAATGPSVNFDATKFCKTCDAQGHDGRLHRVRKSKFSREELIELGVLPVEVQ